MKINVIVVGSHFGSHFIPIYQKHPDVGRVALCDNDNSALKKIGDKFDIHFRFNSLAKALEDSSFNAVHLVTPIPFHAKQSIEVLNAKKHCACTVPMATSIKDIKDIILAVNKNRKNYMMMETAVYTRHMFHALEMNKKNEFGRIQFLRGAHYQDMENWPKYWLGLPPMWYATHAIAPLLTISNSRAISVRCSGSGKMRTNLHKQYGNPYPIETAIFQLNKKGLAAEVTRSLFHTARGYTESFSVYGEKATFEWEQIDKIENPLVFKMNINKKLTAENRGRPQSASRIAPIDRANLLPDAIAPFSKGVLYDETNPQKNFKVGGGHGGSHPHLVHEFVRSIIEKRKPWLNEIKAANITAAGICAHISAIQGGKTVMVPKFKANK